MRMKKCFKYGCGMPSGGYMLITFGLIFVTFLATLLIYLPSLVILTLVQECRPCDGNITVKSQIYTLSKQRLSTCYYKSNNNEEIKRDTHVAKKCIYISVATVIIGIVINCCLYFVKQKNCYIVQAYGVTA